jgi:hypothetical protein
VDEPAVTGSALVDTELDARREKETRSAWRSTAVRSERCDREGALGTNVIEGGGGGESVWGCTWRRWRLVMSHP